MYRWTVKNEDTEEFVRTWEEGTLKIQTHCTGAMGSILLRSSENPEHFFRNGTLAEQRDLGGSPKNYVIAAVTRPKARSDGRATGGEREIMTSSGPSCCAVLFYHLAHYVELAGAPL